MGVELLVGVAVGVEVGFVDEPGVGLGVGVEVMAVRVDMMVALLQAMLVPVESVGLTLRLAPAMPICDVPVPTTTKVKFASTPDDSIEVPVAGSASFSPL